MRYSTFFQQLTGSSPYGFQEKLGQLLQSGQSVVLRAPTGSGKTWGTVAPFVHALRSGKPIADRLIYALPLRALATSLHTGVSERLREYWPEVGWERVGKDREYGGERRYCSLQFGGEANDPFLESDIIFTTIDQVLSGYLFCPLSLPDRLANVPPGALVGSLVVVDETHLLDVPSAMGTTVEMLDRLKGFCQFVLTTATMSEEAVGWLSQKLGATALLMAADEMRALPSQQGKQRSWRWCADRISADRISAEHGCGRSLVIVNTVTRAQEVYRELKQRLFGSETRLMLLHSRFYPEDRAAVEHELAAWFGPKAAASDVILVTTQVVEAGMDISAERLHTELAPMNSLIQRAGRVARYPHRNKGIVTVYEVENLRPYNDTAGAELTRHLLDGLPAEGRVVDGSEELHWIEQVHGEGERRALRAFDNLSERRREVQQTMQEGERGALSTLVRDARSVNVLLSSDPGEVNFSGRTEQGRKMGWPRLLSVPVSSLFQLAGEVARQGEPWVMQGAASARGGESQKGLELEWKVLGSKGEIAGQWLVAVHPNYARYSNEIGLELGQAGEEAGVRYGAVSPRPRYQYEREAWVDHARRVVDAGQRMRREYGIAERCLARALAVGEAEVQRWIDLVCALHDAGKLSEEWQAKAWTWEEKKTGPPAGGWEPLAHTTYNPATDWGEAERMPPHACEGAFAVAGAVIGFLMAGIDEEMAGLVGQPLVSAIARHHGARAGTVGRFTMRLDAVALLGQEVGGSAAIGLIRGSLSQGDADDFRSFLIDMTALQSPAVWCLYAHVCRRLRLADQAGTKGNA